MEKSKFVFRNVALSIVLFGVFGLLLLTFVTNRNPNSPYRMELAIRSNDLREVNSLLKMGADANLRLRGNRYWEPALHIACEERKPKIVRALLIGGADPNSLNYDGRSAFSSVIFGSDNGTDDEAIECCRTLLEFGGNVNIKETGNVQIRQTGDNPLILAVSRVQNAVVVWFVENGADLNYIYGSGTALHNACDRQINQNSRETVLILLRGGADATLRNKEGKTAVELLKRLNNESVVASIFPQASDS